MGSNWHSTQKAFVKYKSYLDRIIAGELEFPTDNPKSLAKTLRGVVKYVRDNREIGYESLYNATISATPYMVVVTRIELEHPKIRPFRLANLYQILGELSSHTKNTIYVFSDVILSEEEREMVKEFCKSEGFSYLEEQGAIKIKT